MKKIIFLIVAIIFSILIYAVSMPKEENEKELENSDILQRKAEIEKQAKQLLSEMTLEEKVGQMFFVRVPKEGAGEMISKYHLGGYILYARDFEYQTKEGMTKTIQNYQKQSHIPLFIGVDEEGGKVNRASLYSAFRKEPFSSSQALYKEGGMEQIVLDTNEKSTFLKNLGINVNFAPVGDVSTNPNDYIYQRSFGQDAKKTSEYVKNVVKTMKENKIGSVLKHFPGYGNNIDTHTGIAYDERPYKTFEQSDFLPFQSGIKEGVDFVLVSHNIVTSMDKNYPASLSKKVHQILREDLDFDGLMITDDLYMDAIQKFAGKEEVAVLAIQAFNDVICCTDFEIQIPAVLRAVKSGEIDMKQVNESVLRILKKKIELGLF